MRQLPPTTSWSQVYAEAPFDTQASSVQPRPSSHAAGSPISQVPCWQLSPTVHPSPSASQGVPSSRGVQLVADASGAHTRQGFTGDASPAW